MGLVPFANNWAYLDIELGWLERLLLVAVSQQKKNLKSVARVAKNSSDKATSDWWQGLVTITTNRAYDDTAPKAGSGPSLGYQKTLDQRITLSRASKVALGLPAMQTGLGLSLFEKKLVLMALAPEVQVRYGKLYHYLQTGTHCTKGSLPTLDLALRILCRNDAERRLARTRLAGSNSLLERRVLHCVGESSTLLGSQLRLADEWIDYLLAENPDPSWPMRFVMTDRFAQRCRVKISWSELVLADAVKTQLELATAQTASRVLLVGETGVGKDQVAIALAAHLNRSLYSLDLTQVPQSDWHACLKELNNAKYSIVLLKGAHRWLGRASSTSIDQALLQKWVNQSSAHIVCTVQHRHLVRRHWRHQLTVIDVPNPNADLRLQLWKQAFPNGVKSMGKVRWQTLAEVLELVPGKIKAVGQTATKLAGNESVTIDHLQQALDQQGYAWKLR